MKGRILYLLSIFAFLSLGVKAQSVFWQDDFSNPAQWNLNTNLGTNVSPAQGSNDPKYNPWEINNLNFFTPSGPISGNSLKITIQPGTDFDGLGLSAGYTGYDPFNVNEPNQTDAIAVLNTNIDATGKTGIILQFDYQTGGWLGDDYGTVLYSIDGGATWTELDNSISVQYNTIDANNNVIGISQTKPAAPANSSDQNAFSNIDGVSSGSYWHTAKITLPPACDNQPDLRIGFRWRNIVHTSNSPDYVGVSFNIDNIKLLVNPPTASFTFSPASPCAGDVITLDASASTPGGGTSITEYLWEFPGGTPSSTTTTTPTTTVTYTSSGQYYPRLRVVNNNNDTSDYFIVTLNVANCAPKAIINGPLQVCMDSSATYSDGSLNMTSAYAPLSWNWTFNSATPNSANTQGPHSVIWNTVGKYPVTLDVSNNYGNDATTIDVDVIDCSCNSAVSRTKFFFESFDTDCNHIDYITSAVPAGWIITDVGTQGTDPNTWYISGQENGNGNGNCGSACTGSPADATLHVSSTTLGDLGAAYDAGGCIWGIGCTQTNKRITANVPTTGYQNITINFEYMENGEAADDNAYFVYSTNGGATWTEIDLPKTSVCSSGQGRWTAYSYIFTSSAVENNPNFVIGFRWQNDQDGVGTDPSFAVDNIELWGDPISGGGFVFTGAINNDWHTAGNWSSGSVPTINDDVQIPAGKTAVISTANAAGKNICNFGTIEIQNDLTLSVGASLLNQGTIRTTTTNQAGDVIFVGTTCVYKGSGQNIDADYEIASSSTTTLDANLSCRTFINNGTLNWQGKTITIHRNLVINSTSSSNDVSSTIVVNGPCTTCLDNSPTQDLTGTSANFMIPNLIIDKSAGTANVLNTFDITQLLHIKNGYVIQPTTGLLTGAGNFTMTGGEYWMANLSPTLLPNLSGTYSITGGKIKLNGTGNQDLRGEQYFKLEFAGIGVKTLNGNTNVADSLIFSLPTTTGNYVDAQTFTLTENNNSPNIVYRIGGHVVGEFARAIKPGNNYRFYVGSDGSGVTYYEPIDIYPDNNFTGPTLLTVKFDATAPAPGTISPALTEFGATFNTMETEGFWTVIENNPLTAGSYTVTQYPSAGWTFSSVSYTQVKQANSGSAWTFGTSSRISALKRKGYTTFSNFGIASSMDPLAETFSLVGFTKTNYNLLQANLANLRLANANIELQRSQNETSWKTIFKTSNNYVMFKDYDIEQNKIYKYRLKITDESGQTEYSNIVALRSVQSSTNKIEAKIYPVPFKDELSIAVNSDGDYQISIYNSIGQMIYNSPQKGAISIDTKAWGPGIYLIEIKTSQGTITQKVNK